MTISFDQTLKAARVEFDREYLKHHLEAHGGKLSKLVPISGMALSSLYVMAHRLGIFEAGASHA